MIKRTRKVNGKLIAQEEGVLNMMKNPRPYSFMDTLKVLVEQIIRLLKKLYKKNTPITKSHGVMKATEMLHFLTILDIF